MTRGERGGDDARRTRRRRRWRGERERPLSRVLGRVALALDLVQPDRHGVVELVDPCLFEATRGGCDGKPHVDPTYQRICGILGIRHTVVPTPGLVADAAKVRAALRDCGDGRTALSRLHHDST